MDSSNEPKEPKRSLTLHIDDHKIVHLVFPNGNSFDFPLEYMVFGSKTSLDCDLIIKVPLKFTELNLRTDVFNVICEILDAIMGPIINTPKVINSSLGYWSNGAILWAQKGSDIAEINNGIIATFQNHPGLQMYDVCPLTLHLKRNLTYKITTTVRDLLCKMNKTRFSGTDSEIMDLSCNLVNGILRILEIRQYNKGDLKGFLFALLQGLQIPHKLSISLCDVLDDETCVLVRALEVNNTNKNNKKRPIEALVDAVTKNDDAKITLTIHTIFADNLSDANKLRQILSSDNLTTDLRDELDKIYDTGVIRLNRLIRNVRRIQFLGVRIDLLRLLDLSKIVYMIDPADRYKDITFKIGQCMALMDGLELYDKAELADRYPELSVFLWRKKPTTDDLVGLTKFVNIFLDRVVSHQIYTRDLCEELRHNK